MTFHEKSAATMLGLLSIVYGWYFIGVFGQLADAPAREIAFRGMLLASVVVLVVLAVASHIVLAIASYRDLDVPTDERDRLITMRAERFGGWFVAGGATLGLLLIIADVESFWTANAILAGLVIGQIVEYASMLISYRRGI